MNKQQYQETLQEEVATVEKQPEKRKTVSRQQVFKYWRDKAITKDGGVVPDDGKYHEDQIPVIEFVDEPRCFACGKPIRGVTDIQCFNHVNSGKPLEALWNKVGSERKGLQRCHIVPRQGGGSDEPSNIVLMCDECHAESPDTTIPKLFFMWVYRKRHEFPHTLIDHDLCKIMDEIFKLCEELGKDPFSGDLEKMPKAYNHGAKMSDSSIMYAYVESCNPKNSEK